MSAIDQRLASTFAAQHALVTRRQVLAAGGNDSLIRRRLRSGRWEPAERAVFAMAGVGWTWRRHLAAMVFSLPVARASHRAQASLYGVGDLSRPPLEICVPADRTPERSFEARATAAEAEVVIHEAEDYAIDPTTTVDGIPTAPVLRLAVDLGAVLPWERYRNSMGELRADHGVGWDALERTYRRHSRQGRDGVGSLRDLLDRHYGQVGAPSEVVEHRCADLLTGAGLPAPVHQHPVRRHDGRMAYLDLSYPWWRIGIETEGRVHDREDVRQRDHQRRNVLQLTGWTLFHFTWEDVTHRRSYVVTTVTSAIDHAKSILAPAN